MYGKPGLPIGGNREMPGHASRYTAALIGLCRHIEGRISVGCLALPAAGLR